MAIKIGSKHLSLPILQGGMGVGISMDRLAGAVAAKGGMGTISTAACGFREVDYAENHQKANLRALDRQVRRARELARGAGLVAVNAMVATVQYDDSIRTALRAGVDAVVSGAGLPLQLPAIAAEVPGNDAALAPIVSSGKAAALISKVWDKRYHRIPDFVVLEGPLAGGHLGFSPEEAKAAQEGRSVPLSRLLREVRDALAPWREKYGRDVPIFVAGGVANGAEMAQLMREGAAGAQFATRFIATEECDASEDYKKILLNAKAEDVTIVKSPVGMPGRALRSPLVCRVDEGNQPQPARCINCLVPCKKLESPYCISQALIAAWHGDWENGLFFCGANVGQVDRLSTVGEQVDQIMTEWRAVQ